MSLTGSQPVPRDHGIDGGRGLTVSPPFRGETDETVPHARDLQDELNARLAERVGTAVARRQQTAAVRQQLGERRTAGKTRRHANRLKETTMTTPTTVTTGRISRCRYMRLSGDLCTAEALDPTADVLICSKHASRVMQLVSRQMSVRSSGDGRA